MLVHNPFYDLATSNCNALDCNQLRSILLDLFIKWAYLKQNLQNYKFEVAKS